MTRCTHRPFHRYLGVIASLTLVVLSITGIALNHSDDLKLSTQYVESQSILNWYGIKPSSNLTYQVDETQWISQWHSRAYLNRQPIFSATAPLIGAIKVDANLIILAEPTTLSAVDTSAQVVWQLDALDGIPDSISSIALANHSDETVLVIKTVSQSPAGYLNLKTLEWVPDTKTSSEMFEVPTMAASPQNRSPLPIELSDALQNLTRQHQITWERLLLDIHSGRILKYYHTWIMDIFGLLLLILAISGCVLFYQHSSRRRRLR